MESLSTYFSEDSLNQIFKIDCFEKTDEAFKKTHYPLSFNFHSAKENRDVIVSESDLLNDEWEQLTFEKRQANGIMIRPFVVWGATGTGKTELCRYLELNLKKTKDYLPIRVSKRELAMGGILGIAQSLSPDKLDITDALLKKHGGYEPVEFFKNILGIIANQDPNNKYIKIVETEGHEGEIYRYIAELIVQNLKARAEELAPGKDIEQFKSKALFLSDRDGYVERGEIGGYKINTKYLNEKLYDQLVPQFYGISSVEKLLYNYIEKVNNDGKIPVFLFDDVTFVGEKINELIPVITDISADSGYMCDFIIGTTTEFYKKHFAGAFSDTIQARISEIKLSPGGNSNTKSAEWLLPTETDGDENKGLAHFLEFCLRYINGAYIIPKKEIKAKVPKEFTDGSDLYYPFTKTFLINLYYRIIHEMNKQQPISLTPRTIIKILNHVMITSFETGALLSSDIEGTFYIESEFLFNFNDDSTFQKHADYYNAIWWYGNHESNENDGDSDIVSISRKMLSLVELEKEANIVDPDKDPIEYLVTKFEVVSRNSDRDSYIPPGSDVKPIDHSVETEKSIIKKWMTGAKDAKISTNTLLNGINSIIKSINGNFVGSKNYSNFINPSSSRAISKTDGCMFALKYVAPGKNEAPITLSMYPLTDDDTTIAIVPNTSLVEKYNTQIENSLCIFFTVNDYYNAQKIGGSKDKEEISRLQAEVLRSHIDDFHNILKRQNISLQESLEDTLGCSLDAFCLSLYIVLSKLLNPSVLISNTYSNPESILKIYAERQNCSKFDRSYLDLSIQNKYPTLNDYYIAEGLFLSRFTLGGGDLKLGLVDYIRLEKALEEISNNPYKIIQSVKAADIPHEFTISKGDLEFKSFVQRIQSSLSVLLKSNIHFSKDDYKEYVEQIKAAGDFRKFNSKYLEYVGHLKKVQNYENGALRRAYNQLSEGTFNRETAELNEIGKHIATVEKIPASEEKTILELLVAYLLGEYGNSYTVTFLRCLDSVIESAKNNTLAKEEYDMDQLNNAIKRFNRAVSEVSK